MLNNNVQHDYIKASFEGIVSHLVKYAAVELFVPVKAPQMTLK